jgi:hypothetical protein
MPMLLQRENKMYDIKIFFYKKLLFNEKYIANVLEYYYLDNDSKLRVIIFNEEINDIEIVEYEYCSIINEYERDDILIVSRNEYKIIFLITSKLDGEDADVLE